MTRQLTRYDAAMGTEQAGATRWLTGEEQSVWRAYLDMNGRLNAQLNRHMQTDAGISLVDFAVLVQVSEHPDGQPRARDLAVSLGWEKSRLSHQVARMQRRGLVERRDCDEDRRGAVIVLTDCGRRTIADAAAKHVAAVRRYLFDHLSGDELRTFGSIASGVTERLDAAWPGESTSCAGVDQENCT